MCSTQSLTKTKATVSSGLALQPGPRVPRSHMHRWDLLFNASFQNSNPLRHFPFINQKQRTPKSIRLLLPNKNHTKVWTDLNYLIGVAHLRVFVVQKQGVKEDGPGGGLYPYLLSDSCSWGTVRTLFHRSKKSINHWISSTSATLFVLVLVIALSLFKWRVWF